MPAIFKVCITILKNYIVLLLKGYLINIQQNGNSLYKLQLLFYYPHLLFYGINVQLKTEH